MKVVGDVMNPGVVCTRPDMSLREVERLFTDRRITGAPVKHNIVPEITNP